MFEGGKPSLGKRNTDLAGEGGVPGPQGALPHDCPQGTVGKSGAQSGGPELGTTPHSLPPPGSTPFPAGSPIPLPPGPVAGPGALGWPAELSLSPQLWPEAPSGGQGLGRCCFASRKDQPIPEHADVMSSGLTGWSRGHGRARGGAGSAQNPGAQEQPTHCSTELGPAGGLPVCPSLRGGCLSGAQSPLGRAKAGRCLQSFLGHRTRVQTPASSRIQEGFVFS